MNNGESRLLSAELLLNAPAEAVQRPHVADACFFVLISRKADLSCYDMPARPGPRKSSVYAFTTHNPRPPPPQKPWPVDETKVDTYTGSSETELLRKLTGRLPSVGSPNTRPSPDDGETTGAGPSGAGTVRGPGSSDKGGEQEQNSEGADSVALGAAEALIDAFDKNVDVARLLRDVRHHGATDLRRGSGSSPRSALPVPPADTTIAGSGLRRSPVTAGAARLGGKPSAAAGGGTDSDSSVGAASLKPAASSSRKSRGEVEAEAAEQGASGG